jgi:malonyl-CoA decarboxylase
MPERNLLSDLMRRVAQSGRLVGLKSPAPDPLAMCEEILGDQGEVSGLVTALRILDQCEARNDAELLGFFGQVVARFGVNEEALAKAIRNWTPGNAAAARTIHRVSEPRSQELIRRINRAPGATARLVALRARLMRLTVEAPDLAGLDADFLHLFSSWFNRGFLELRHIDWNSPAQVLEKIISYEAVHEITGWDDLRQRVADPDRRLFGFFHPAMPGDPLIFVEVALMSGIPGAIGEIIAAKRDRLAPEKATTAVFYSISNCQQGLRGISFGNFLIKQVVAELMRELPGLTTFVTLSPVPGLRKWAERARAEKDELLAGLDWEGENPPDELAAKIAARYLTRARRPGGTAFDPVAHFHLGNGAALHAVHTQADESMAGQANAWGVMVNYLYDGAKIETNHQAYARDGRIAASSKVLALAKK